VQAGFNLRKSGKGGTKVLIFRFADQRSLHSKKKGDPGIRTKYSSGGKGPGLGDRGMRGWERLEGMTLPLRKLT